MAMMALNSIISPLWCKGHTAVAAPRAWDSSQQLALSSGSSIQFHSRRTLKVDIFSSRGFAVGDRSWSTRGRSAISSVESRGARGDAGAVSSVAASETSPKKLEESGDSYFLRDTRPVILFDGVCNMCNGGVNFMLDNDKDGKLRFAALQSEAGRALLVRSGRAPDDISSMVLVDKDRSYIKSDAMLRIGQYLNFPYAPAASIGLIVPTFLRDALYGTVADNRYSIFGKTNACRLSDSRFGERFIE